MLRAIYAFARERSHDDRATYHASATLERAPAPGDLADVALPALLDARQSLHVTFGSVLCAAGLRNTVGFNDDTRAFASIPSRHDVWQRVTCNWLAGLVVRGLLDEEDALEMAHDCAYHLARRAYNLDPNGRPE